MLKLINLFKNEEIELGVFKFPAGEVHFKRGYADITGEWKIITDLQNSDEIMLLMQLSDQLNGEVHLDLRYTPYARQDRRTSKFEPFSFKTFANMINSCGFASVKIYDPHSDVTPALLNQVEVIRRDETARDFLWEFHKDEAVIISPDAGAYKTNERIANSHGMPHFHATKHRDTATGSISKVTLHADYSDILGKDIIILDDICDGGRTFVELAKVLKIWSPKTIHLFTTVGIYSNGLEELSEYFDSIKCFHKLGEIK